eukprot:5906420-Amphidinium_carterae.1
MTDLTLWDQTSSVWHSIADFFGRRGDLAHGSAPLGLAQGKVPAIMRGYAEEQAISHFAMAQRWVMAVQQLANTIAILLAVGHCHSAMTSRVS